MTERIQRLLERVPGYNGYRGKEDRRDVDKRLRDGIADTLGSLVDSLTRRNAELVAERSLTSVSVMERLISRTRHLADRVRTASYGYAGIFSERSVDDGVLEQLRQFDLAFQRQLATLADLAGRLSGSNAPLESDIRAYEDELNRLGTLFDARGDVLDAGQPAKDAGILAILDAPDSTKPSPMLGLHVNDTLSVLGDNYQVDALIRFEGGGSTLVLARVGATSRTWFLGSSAANVRTAKLTEQPDDPDVTAFESSGKVTILTASGGETSTTAPYTYTEIENDQVEFSYDIGGDIRILRGNAINDLDVEIYGKASV